MEFLAIFSVLFRGIEYAIFLYHRVKFWDKERQMFLYNALAIFLTSAIIFGLSTYALGGYILILTNGHVTIVDEWSPFTNKLVFGFVFGMLFPLSYYATIGFGGGSLQVLIQTIKGEKYKSYGGIA